jgi:flagellar basal body rod protein FlgB
MATDTTIDAVRLALGLQELRARVASLNIANAGTPSAQALRVDFASVQGALTPSADAAQIGAAIDALTGIAPQPTGEGIHLDEQVTDLTSASTNYQTLTEALSRQFGLMRLAITGRS